MLRVPKPWIPGKQYAVEIRGLRNVTRVAGDATGVLTVPKPTAADTTARGADSLRPRPDSLKRRPIKKTP